MLQRRQRRRRASSPSARISIGCSQAKFVWLQGLTSRPDLNGKAVTVLAAPEDGRVAVRIAGRSLFGTAEEDIRVKVAAARKSLFSGT